MAAVLDFILLAAAAAALTDIEAALIALGIGVGVVGLRFRKGLLGFIALGLLFTNVAVWMLPGALSNISHNEGLVDTALPGFLAIASIAGVVGVLGYALALDQRIGRVVAVLAFIALIAALLVPFGVGEKQVETVGDIPLEMKDVKFADEDIEAEAGTLTFLVSNGDLFWHTFTIEELDVDLRVPVRAERRVSFEAPEGTYEFVCAIPGHTQAGMKGTLTVR